MNNHLYIKNKYNNADVFFITFFTAIFGYIAYLLVLSQINVNKEYDIQIFILSWLGILLGIFVLLTWYKLTHTLLSTYTIFILFFFLFNYGQSIMWAFGIHNPLEIGQQPMYRNFGVASDADIIAAQVITLICILMFHLGAVLCFRPRKRNKNREDSKTLKAIYYSCLILGILVIPTTLYYAYSDFQIASVHGYGALYYSEFARTDATVLALVQKSFFPCLVGLLIGSKYNKKVKIFVYLIFSIYFILSLLAGDRGSWVYKILILIWLSHVCYKPIRFKLFAKYLIVGFGILYITNILVSIRNLGLSNISVDKIMETASLEKSPFISAIFEMGSSMQPTIILQKYGWDVWPYANSYLLSFIGMVTNKLIYSLNIPFDLLSSWFSQDYLGISWGAGFSIIAEALLNGGPILAPVFLIILGYIITSMIYIEDGMNFKEQPLRYFFAAASLSIFINLTRNELHLVLKDWFYGVLLLFLFILLIRFLMKSESKNSV